MEFRLTRSTAESLARQILLGLDCACLQTIQPIKEITQAVPQGHTTSHTLHANKGARTILNPPQCFNKAQLILWHGSLL